MQKTDERSNTELVLTNYSLLEYYNFPHCCLHPLSWPSTSYTDEQVLTVCFVQSMEVSKFIMWFFFCLYIAFNDKSKHCKKKWIETTTRKI